MHKVNKLLFLSAILALASVFLLASCSSVKKPPAEYDPGKGWKLTWSDEFEGTTLNTTNWEIETGEGGWGNSELQFYTSRPENIIVSNGLLTITTRREDMNISSFTSARIKSYGKYKFDKGKIVARIKLPYGKGMWPAFWMMGENRYEVGWPKCGEIDIMEIRGGEEDYGDGILIGTVHYYGEGHHQSIAYSEGNKDPNDEGAKPYPFYHDFHYFELEKDEKFLKFRLDGREYQSIDISDTDIFYAFQQPFYLLLNVAVGGKFSQIYDADLITAKFPQYMYVDWIRTYTKE